MSANTPTVSQTAEPLPPPTERYSVVRWLHKNLFSTWYNALLTVVMLALAALLVRSVLEWALTQARWEVISANLRLFMVGQYPVTALWRIWACVALLAFLIGMSWGIWGRMQRGGAVAFGALPFILAIITSDEPSRGALVVTGIAGIVGYALSGRWGAVVQRVSIIGWILYFPILFVLVSGLDAAESVLPPVPTNLWGVAAHAAFDGGRHRVFLPARRFAGAGAAVEIAGD